MMFKTKSLFYWFALMVGAISQMSFIFSNNFNINSLQEYSISELEEYKEKVESGLGRISSFSFRSGVGAIGFRSKQFKDAEAPFWLKIDLEETYEIDQIVMVPMVWKNIQQQGFLADAFPVNFKIIIGNDNEEGIVVAEFDESDNILPRVAPLVVNFAKTKASWVCIDVAKHSRREIDKKYNMQLSELFVFSGEQNVALHKKVMISSGHDWSSGSPFANEFLVDNLVPYVMDTAAQYFSKSYLSDFGEKPELTIDLGQIKNFTGLRLHSVEQGNTIPQAFAGDLGMPKHLVVYGANREDFSDAKVIFDYQWEYIYEIGSIMEWAIPEAEYRYIKFQAKELGPAFGLDTQRARFGFAEIEILNQGENIARRALASTTGQINRNREPKSLTDGHNIFGHIISPRMWMTQLAMRHELDITNQLLAEELSQRYNKQKKALLWSKRLAVFLIIFIAFGIVFARMLKIKSDMRIRERITANLHDELGANLHAIGLLGDLAKSSINDKEELIDTVDMMRSLTERTGESARHCVHMIEADNICEDLIAEMQKEAKRLLSDLSYEISVEGKEHVAQLNTRTSIDILLFFKESLVNIIRHSGAENVKIAVRANHKGFSLSVKDDGIGLNGKLPKALIRRARLLRAYYKFEENDNEQGLQVTLRVKKRLLS